MKKVLLTLVAVLALGSVNAQSNWDKSGDWAYQQSIEERQFEMTTVGSKVSGSKHPDVGIRLWVDLSLNSENRVVFEALLGGVHVAYDDSSEDMNYVTIETIMDGDKSTIKKYSAKVYNKKGYLKLKSADGKLVNFYKDVKASNNIFIKVSVGNNTLAVFKFSTSGFTKASGMGHDFLWGLGDNPFSSSDSNDDNPF